MKRFLYKCLVSASFLSLAACGAVESDRAANEALVEESAGTTEAGRSASQTSDAGENGGNPIAVSLPRMAYAFNYAFRLEGGKIAPLQQKHADMCEAQGPTACRIVSLTRSGEPGEDLRGELQLMVASDKARGFGTLLEAASSADGGETVRSDIAGEDVSKQLVDTEARLRTRIALRDRLMEVLRTRKGSVEELVEAERGVARVNEEIDQARSWLEETRGRVAFSRMTLVYGEARPGGSFIAPINGALGAVGTILGSLTALMILAATVGVPLLLGALGVRAVKRRLSPAEAEA